MASRKRPETRKTPEVVVRRKSKRSRSPRELEPEAKKLSVKGPGTACACCFNNSAIRGSHAGGGWSGVWVLLGPEAVPSFRCLSVHFVCRACDTLETGLNLPQVTDEADKLHDIRHNRLQIPCLSQDFYTPRTT